MPFFAHSTKSIFSRQKVPYFTISRQKAHKALACILALIVYSQGPWFTRRVAAELEHFILVCPTPTQSSKHCAIVQGSHFESGGKMAAAHSSIWMQISLFLQPQCPIKGGCSKRSHLVTVLHCVVNCVLQNKSNHGTAAEAERLELAQMWFKPAHCCCTFVYIPLWGKYYVAKIFGYLTDLCNKFMRKRVGFVLQYCSITPLQYCRLALDCALLIAYCSSTVAACVMHCRLHCNSIAVVGV